MTTTNADSGNQTSATEKTDKPAPSLQEELRAALQAIVDLQPHPFKATDGVREPRYDFVCYSCRHRWEAETPDADCPRAGCGTTNRFSVDNTPSVMGGGDGS